MDAPLSVVFNFTHPLDMAVALAIGFGFGFVLERSGFGRADTLTAIFYGRDFRVLRVMFSAIVTAMLGLYFLDLTGILPLGNIGILDTYLLPQLVGGLLLGAGFIIGGHCPGTSIVAAASGKTDAALFVGGMLIGATVFTLGFDTFKPLQNATAMGRVLIHEFFRLPAGVLVLAVALFAVASFWLVSKIEMRVNERKSA
jgi:uncharacterized protein